MVKDISTRNYYGRFRILEANDNRLVGNKIISDGWRSYSNLSSLGLHHELIIHDDYFVDSNDSEVHTQTVEGTWSVIKRFLRKHGTRRSPHEFEYGRIFLQMGKKGRISRPY
ncbi:hypothetical protein HZS_58 [Henneguya salminicola]|nr:hypothetical protein HZS_58 [Henneguya salminicola]